MADNEENTRGGRPSIGEIAKTGAADAARGISSALMGSAYRSFGKAFDGGGYTPRGMRPDTSYLDNWEREGIASQGRLEQRWHVSEFENFKKTHLNKYQAFQRDLLDKYQGITNNLKEGVWEHSNGDVENFDFANPAHVAKMSRLKGQIEQEAMSAMTDAQIELNIAASSDYSTNPIVDKVIQQMMEGQTRQLAGQFQTPMSNKQAQHDMSQRTGEADIQYKQALTRGADATTATAAGKYKSTDAVFRDLGPGGAARYFANNVDGKQLLDGTEFPAFVTRLQQQTAADFVRRQKWNPQEAGLEANQESTQAFVESESPRIRQRAFYEWTKQEYGEDAAEAAASDRPGMKGDIAPPFSYDVKTNPTKKDTKEKTDKWQALGLVKANEELARNPDMSPEAVKDWLMDEWLPAALDGEDIQEDGAYLTQFDGLTADQANKAAAPYIKAVREALKDIFKFIGSGEGTEGLLPNQRSARRGRPGRGGALSRAGSMFIDKITPDSLFPNVGKGIYPPNTRELLPKKAEPKE